MIRKTHIDQIERWANFVRENPRKWKEIHTEFINAIFKKHQQVVERLKKTKEGKDKLRELNQQRILSPNRQRRK